MLKKINNLPALAAIWRNAKISGTSAYHKIIKHNNRLTSNDSLTLKNIIVPQSGYIVITDLNKIGDTITISFASDFNEFLKNFDGDVNLIVIVYLYKRRLWLTPEFMLFDKTVTIKSQFVYYEIEMNLKPINIPFNKYNNAIIYAAVYLIWMIGELMITQVHLPEK